MCAAPVGAVVFDAYGTLLEVGSHTAACAAPAPHTPPPHTALCAARWRGKQLEYPFLRSRMGRYADLWQVTAEAQ
jgi:HAD superfamily hydrolase (TIGR01493 family)